MDFKMGPALPSKAFHTAQPVYAQVRLEVDNAQLQRMGWLAAARFSYSRRGSQGEVFEVLSTYFSPSRRITHRSRGDVIRCRRKPWKRVGLPKVQASC